VAGAGNRLGGSSRKSGGQVAEKRIQVRGNFRPVNTMARPVRGENPYNRFSGHAEENLATAQRYLERRGFKVNVYNDPSDKAIARAGLGIKQISLNRAHDADYWSNPRLRAIDYRRIGHLASSSPMATLYHEIGHTRDRMSLNRFIAGGEREALNWQSTVPGAGARRLKQAWRNRDLARRVSIYASSNPAEFNAEVYSGRRTGRRYDFQVMRAYGQSSGRKAPSLRSQLSR
jgi:hypothetical protein